MSIIKKNWGTCEKSFSLYLRMSVDLDGRSYHAQMSIGPGYHGMPTHYIERELRMRIMRAIEDDLFGPRT